MNKLKARFKVLSLNVFRFNLGGYDRRRFVDLPIIADILEALKLILIKELPFQPSVMTFLRVPCLIICVNLTHGIISTKDTFIQVFPFLCFMVTAFHCLNIQLFTNFVMEMQKRDAMKISQTENVNGLTMEFNSKVTALATANDRK